MSKRLAILVPLVLLLGGCSGEMQSIVGDSFNLGVHLGLGENAMRVKDYQKAETEFKEAVALSKKTTDKSNAGEALTRLGQVYNRQDKHDKAKEMFSKAADAYEEASSGILLKSDKKIWAQCLYEYKTLLEDSGEKDEAKEVGKKLRQLRDDLGSEGTKANLQEF